MVVTSDLTQDILAARDRLAPYVRLTPCEQSSAFSERLASDIWFKSEHLQHTGSFKARGALHKLLRTDPQDRARGVVTASSGNHGAGVAWAGHTLGARVAVFVPEGASEAKVAMISGYGAEVRTFGTDGLDTEIHAREVAAESGYVYVSPYNDPDVVSGQGTVGVELLEQMQQLDNVIVAVGGGGLIGGIATFLKARLPNVKVIGALPERSPVMARSVKAGRIIEMQSEPTLSDGTAGGVEADSITFALCQSLVDDWVLISEDEIAAAMRAFIADHHQLIEGAAGVAVAALERKAQELKGQRTAVVVCGGNVSLATLRRVLSVEGHSAKSGGAN